MDIRQPQSPTRQRIPKIQRAIRRIWRNQNFKQGTPQHEQQEAQVTTHFPPKFLNFFFRKYLEYMELTKAFFNKQAKRRIKIQELDRESLFSEIRKIRGEIRFNNNSFVNMFTNQNNDTDEDILKKISNFQTKKIIGGSKASDLTQSRTKLNTEMLDSSVASEMKIWKGRGSRKRSRASKFSKNTKISRISRVKKESKDSKRITKSTFMSKGKQSVVSSRSGSGSLRIVKVKKRKNVNFKDEKSGGNGWLQIGQNGDQMRRTRPSRFKMSPKGGITVTGVENPNNFKNTSPPKKYQSQSIISSKMKKSPIKPLNLKFSPEDFDYEQTSQISKQSKSNSEISDFRKSLNNFQSSKQNQIIEKKVEESDKLTVLESVHNQIYELNKANLIVKSSQSQAYPDSLASALQIPTPNIVKNQVNLSTFKTANISRKVSQQEINKFQSQKIVQNATKQDHLSPIKVTKPEKVLQNFEKLTPLPFPKIKTKSPFLLPRTMDNTINRRKLSHDPKYFKSGSSVKNKSFIRKKVVKLKLSPNTPDDQNSFNFPKPAVETDHQAILDREMEEQRKSPPLGMYEAFKIYMEKAKQKNRYVDWQTKIYENVATHSDYLSKVSFFTHFLPKNSLNFPQKKINFFSNKLLRS